MKPVKIVIPTKPWIYSLDSDGHIVGKCVCHRRDFISQGTTSEQPFDSWMTGTLIQFAFPELNADDREFLISGYCPEGWTQLSQGVDRVRFAY